MRFEIETQNGNYRFTDPYDAYEIVVEQVYGEDTRNVSHVAHISATSAQCYCEDPTDDCYEGDGFTIYSIWK